MKITVFTGAGDLAHALAQRVAEQARRQPDLVLGLPTGRSPLAFYRHLIRLAREDAVDLSRATTFNLDEFVGVGPDDAGSYRQYMERHFFRYVNVDRRRINFLDGAARSPEAECERYEDAIAAAGGLDLQILGIGANGHIGFNEPGEHLVSRSHRVRLRAETRRANAALFGGDPYRVPEEALSMGMATILHARAIVLMALGAEKAACVAEMIDGPLTTRLPASFLQLHTDVHVMLDEAAAAGLNGRR
ncbi:MAG: glucosamine-6-phosphate deaminase [Bacteroidales bacterium]